MGILAPGLLRADSGGGSAPPVTLPNRVIGFDFDNGGLLLPVGLTTIPVQVAFAHTIISATIVSFNTVTGLAPAGSIQVDVWRDSYANYPPTVADSITAAAKPTLTGASKATDATLTGWSKTGAAGDIYVATIVSASSIVAASLYLVVDPN